MTETQKLLLTFAVTVLGSGLGTTIIGALFKRRFDAQLERQKALLQRGSRIHERQIDALLAIYSRLERASYFLQRATSSVLLEGETRETLLQNLARELASASDEYSNKKLLIPPTLTIKLDEFFNRFLSGHIDLTYAMHPSTPGGGQRSGLWEQAKEIAYNGLPPLLRAIEAEARTVIHVSD